MAYQGTASGRVVSAFLVFPGIRPMTSTGVPSFPATGSPSRVPFFEPFFFSLHLVVWFASVRGPQGPKRLPVQVSLLETPLPQPTAAPEAPEPEGQLTFTTGVVPLVSIGVASHIPTTCVAFQLGSLFCSGAFGTICLLSRFILLFLLLICGCV